MSAVPFDALSYLAHHVERFPDAPAVVERGDVITFGRLREEVDALMAELHGRGIRPGDVVAVAMPNTWRYVALEIAIPALGAIVLPMPLGTGPREVAWVAERSGAVLAIIDDAAAFPAAAARRAAVRDVLAPAELQGTHDAAPLAVAPDPERIVQIAMTSGTTGMPKLASLSAELKQLTFEGFAGRIGFGPGDRVLPTTPITQGVGEMCLYALRTGACLVMLGAARFDADGVARLIESSQTTVLAGVPTTLRRILHAPALGEVDLGSLRATISAGAPLPRAVAEAWEIRSDSRVCSFYGAMDIGQLSVGSPDDPVEKRWTTVGRPHDRAEMQIVGRTGRPVAPGAEGEICMRGSLVQQRYWGEAEPAGDPDGWSRFGDLGRLDADGFLHITGRIKDTIIRGGNNINPLEVEELLRKAPEILDVCVVGTPHPDLGESATAFVVPAAGASVGFDDIQAVLERARLARYKWPERVELLDELPVGATGKVDRAALRDRLTQLTEGRA